MVAGRGRSCVVQTRNVVWSARRTAAWPGVDPAAAGALQAGRGQLPPPGQGHGAYALAGEFPARLRVAPLDVADPASHAAVALELPLLTEGEPLDLLIYNAGW